MDENNKRIAKNTSFLYIRMMLVMCVQLYTSRIILKKLGVEDFGIYGVVGGIVVMFSSIVGSLGSATSRFFTVELGKGDYTQLKKVFSSALMIHFVMALFVLLICETVGLWFLNNKMVIPDNRLVAANWLLQFSIITTFFSVAQVPYTACIIAHERMDVYAYSGLIDVVLKLLIVFLLPLAPFDSLIFYGLLIMLIQVAMVFFYRIFCYRNFTETHFVMQRDRKFFKSMLMYGIYDFVGSMSVMLQGQGLNMILNVFSGPVVNAARAIAYQVQSATTQFSNNFLTAVKPQIIKYYAQGEIERMMTLVHRSSILAFTLMLAIILPLSINIHFILGLWLGEYPAYTASFTVLVLVTSLLNAFRSPRITVFHATGNIKLSNIVTGGILCMAFPIGYLLMKLGCSPNSVFWGMLGTTVVADCTNLFILRRYISYSILEFVKQVHVPCAVISFITLTAMYPFYELMAEGWTRLISSTLLSTIIILFFTWRLALTAEQRHKIINTLKKKWKQR